MRKNVKGKGAFLKGILFVSAVLLMALTFHSCQRDEVFLNTQELSDAGSGVMSSGLNGEIYLEFPKEVNVGEDFDITFSSKCGKIMIERGYIEEVDVDGVRKVFTGLTCDTDNLLWEAVGEDVFEDCGGATLAGNLAEPGTYVYRAKLNFKAIRGSGCPDCKAFLGNKFECFMITVMAGNENEGTFTDERDGHEYKWVKIGNQIWMAENLAYKTVLGSYAYGNDETKAATYGRLYTWEAAGGAAPEGWRLPSNTDWQELIAYLNANGYGCESTSSIARALAAPGWLSFPTPGAPGYPLCTANTSGFSALPAGYLNTDQNSVHQGSMTYWWSSNKADNPYLTLGYAYWLTYGSALLNQQTMVSGNGFSIRCVKNSD